MSMYITYLEHPEKSETYNRYDGYRHPVVLHRGQWHLGRFPSMERLKQFLDYAGISIGELVEEYETDDCGLYRRWNVDFTVQEEGFTKRMSLPEGAKPFTGLSNGSLVTCYLYNDGRILHIYRPNPNAKAVYNPCSVDEHIKFCRKYGYV